MQTQLIKSITFFQQLLSSQFSTLNRRLVDTLVFLSTCHLFGLTNPNKCRMRCLFRKQTISGTEHDESLSLAASFCAYRVFIALEAIREVVSKSASTLSVYCHQCSAMERILPRDWWSSQAKQPDARGVIRDSDKPSWSSRHSFVERYPTGESRPKNT